MSDYGSRFGKPRPEPEDLEAILARALREEADKVVPAGDGLTKIRARTEGRSRAFAWLPRPQAMLAGVTAVAAVAVGVVVVGQLDSGNSTNVVERAPDAILSQLGSPGPLIQNSQADIERVNPTPEVPIGAEGGELPEVDTQLSEAPDDTLRLAPVTPEQEANQSDNGIPVDQGGNYVAILAPLSGGTYDSPLTLYGKARVFEANVTIDISQNGTVLKRAYATADQGAPELGEWDATIALAPGNYRIDAYALSAEDGETKLASDSIWITIAGTGTGTGVQGSDGAAGPTPSSTPSSTPGSTPSSTPTGTAAPSSALRTQEVPGTEP